ncbi:MAG: ABC transporter substrate-binding protein [Alphaproteobacteria bacterium]|nr:ABC transporter substrate-binding protein [Alphaproteobacteria bacterium]
MKKIFLFLLVLCVAACDNSAKNEVQNGKPTIKVGVVTSLSGKFAENGQNVQKTLELALKDAAPKNVDIEYVYEDFGYEAAHAALAAQKLINVDKVDAIISWSAVAGNVIAPIADRAGIFHFGISNDKNIAKGKYNFIHWTQSEFLADKAVELIEKEQPKNVAMFVVYQPGLQQTADSIESKLHDKNIQTERVNFTIDNKDFNMDVDKFKRKDFDVWYISALPPSLDILLKVIFEKNVNKPLIAVDSFHFSNLKDKLEGMKYVTVPEGDEGLLQRVNEETGSTNYFSLGYVYDAGYILANVYSDLYEKFGHVPSAEEIANRILEIKNFHGSVGEIFVDEGGIFQSEAVVKQIKDGKSVLVK